MTQQASSRLCTASFNFSTQLSAVHWTGSVPMAAGVSLQSSWMQWFVTVVTFSVGNAVQQRVMTTAPSAERTLLLPSM